MHVTWNVKHAERDEALESLFVREQDRILRRLVRVPLDGVSLHCEIDRNLHVREAYASLTLALPDRTWNARGVGVNIPAALRDSVTELLVEMTRGLRQDRRAERKRRGKRVARRTRSG
jgi:hypothetical protein